MKVCAGKADACFAGWLNGNQRDNVGFVAAKCYCGLEIAHHEVRRLMGSDELFDKYDVAMMKQCLMRGGDAVFCPGLDCKNGMIRPAGVKGISACRSTVCSEGNCGTEFCVMCGEKFVQGSVSHAKVDCKNFKRLLDEQSGVAAWAGQQKKGLVKPCPGCKKLVEKNQGCSSHSCVLCGVSYCWKCNQINCKCGVARRRRMRRYQKVGDMRLYCLMGWLVD
jgi:ariadne-1